VTVTVIARCVHGLEWVAAEEIARAVPGAHHIDLSRRAVTFSLPAPHPALLALRTPDDVFLRVGSVDGVGTTKDALPALAGRLAGLAWAGALTAVQRLRGYPEAPRFDVVASLEGRRTYNRFAVENAAGAALAPLVGGTHLVRTGAGATGESGDLTVRIFVHGSTAVAALRLGARPLHRREYKWDTGPGTLHPPVAAALVRLADPRAAEVVLDPFCGDGTIPIEAALAYPKATVRGSDLDPDRLANARSNARRAGAAVTLTLADAARPEPDAAQPDAGRAEPVDVVATNPPWSIAVDATGGLAGSLARFWARLPDLVAPDGRVALITDAALDAPAELRRLGFVTALDTQVRLAGRVSRLALAGPREPRLDAGLATWRERAIAAGVVGESGF
jgi:tRNA (guanine6-N2)-methyltransferase